MTRNKEPSPAIKISTPKTIYCTCNTNFAEVMGCVETWADEGLGDDDWAILRCYLKVYREQSRSTTTQGTAGGSSAEWPRDGPPAVKMPAGPVAGKDWEVDWSDRCKPCLNAARSAHYHAVRRTVCICVRLPSLALLLDTCSLMIITRCVSLC